MKTDGRVTRAIAAAILAGVLGGCRTAGTFDAQRRGELGESVISGWSEFSRMTAAKMMEQYGPPDAVSQSALGWRGKGRWLRIVVRDAGALTQTVAYRVPDAKRLALEDFDRGVRIADDGFALSASASDEALNFLALNLADEIVRGARSPDDARRAYDRTLALASAGKSSPSMQALLFPPRN